MSIRLNRSKKVLACILVLSFAAVSQTFPVWADYPSQQDIYGLEYGDLIMVAADGVYMSPFLYEAKESEQSANTNTRNSKAYDALGFSKIDISALAKYIHVEAITEKQFYDLNFDMKIASVAMTTDEQLLLRTIDNTYCTIKISDEYIKAMELTGAVEKGISQKMTSNSQTKSSVFSTFIMISLIITFALFIGWFYSMSRRAYEPDKMVVGTKDKGKNGVVIPEKKVTFNEVQGIDELKPDLFRLVDSLKHPAKYKKLGARPTKGLILYGPPGTGKTLIAKAISGEAEVPFFSASGSDFVEKYVGVGASRIRDLFSKARKGSTDSFPI